MSVNLDLLFCGLVLAAILLRYLGHWVAGWKSGVLTVVIVGLSILPHPWGASGWVLSYFAGFSVTLAAIALLSIAARAGLPAQLTPRQLRPVCWLVLLTGLWFYPMSLGATAWDPYGAGFNSLCLPGGLLVVGLLALLWRYYLLCALLIAAQVAYAAGLLASENLWDYLIDPWLFCFSIGWLLRNALASKP